MNTKTSSQDRRRSPRRPILETFSLFVVVPEKGPHRLTVRDLSEHGIGFEVDPETWESAEASIKTGDEFEVQFYLNSSLALPLDVRVARVVRQNPDAPFLIGGELTATPSPAHDAYLAFIALLDSLKTAAIIP